MKRFHLNAVVAIIAATFFTAAAGASSVSAAADPYTGMLILDAMCEDKGGTAMFTPYHISRCQAARSNKGFEVERQICEGLLEGRFEVVDTYRRPNHSNWFCFSA